MEKIYPFTRFLLYTAFAVTTATSATAQNGTQKSITDIPLKAHTREVDLFFNEEKPKEPYYRVMILEQRAAPDVPMEAVLVAMKKTAQAEGIDGILLGQLGQQTGSVVTFPHGEGTMSYQRLAGIGIRYRRTVDYMDTILKEQSVSVWIEGNADPKEFTMKYDFYGNNLSMGDRFVHTFFEGQVFPYEDGTSCYATFAGWSCRYNAEEQVFSRKNTTADTSSLSRFYYAEGRLIKAEIVFSSYQSMKKDKWQMEPIYNSGGLLIGRRLMDGKTLVWEEAFTYRLSGLRDKVRRVKVVNGVPVPLFEIKNIYCSDNDLPAPEH